MRGLRRCAAYPALNRPLTILDVERRRHLLSATLALAMWNAMNSHVTGAVVFALGYGAGWLASRKDPDMLGVLRAGTRYPARFDPGKWASEPSHLRDGQETLWKRWSLTLRLDFLAAVPSELVVYNPMGLLITYLHPDRDRVTEQQR